MENILKLKFKLENEKTRTLSIKNAKQTVLAEDVKALGNYIVDNAFIKEDGHKANEVLEAKMYSIEEKEISLA